MLDLIFSPVGKLTAGYREDNKSLAKYYIRAHHMTWKRREKKGSKERFRRRRPDSPLSVLDEIYLAHCDAETDSCRGYYILERDVHYWIDSKGWWIPTLMPIW